MAVLMFVVACEGGRSAPDAFDPLEQGLTPAPIGGGFCCPIAGDTFTCDCFENGGWVPSADIECPAICDLAPSNRQTMDDEHGCPTITGPDTCLPLPDAGIQ